MDVYNKLEKHHFVNGFMHRATAKLRGSSAKGMMALSVTSRKSSGGHLTTLQVIKTWRKCCMTTKLLLWIIIGNLASSEKRQLTNDASSNRDG